MEYRALIQKDDDAKEVAIFGSTLLEATEAWVQGYLEAKPPGWLFRIWAYDPATGDIQFDWCPPSDFDWVVFEPRGFWWKSAKPKNGKPYTREQKAAVGRSIDA